MNEKTMKASNEPVVQAAALTAASRLVAAFRADGKTTLTLEKPDEIRKQIDALTSMLLDSIDQVVGARRRQ